MIDDILGNRRIIDLRCCRRRPLSCHCCASRPSTVAADRPLVIAPYPLDTGAAIKNDMRLGLVPTATWPTSRSCPAGLGETSERRSLTDE